MSKEYFHSFIYLGNKLNERLLTSELKRSTLHSLSEFSDTELLGQPMASRKIIMGSNFIKSFL